MLIKSSPTSKGPEYVFRVRGINLKRPEALCANTLRVLVLLGEDCASLFWSCVMRKDGLHAFLADGGILQAKCIWIYYFVD